MIPAPVLFFCMNSYLHSTSCHARAAALCLWMAVIAAGQGSAPPSDNHTANEMLELMRANDAQFDNVKAVFDNTTYSLVDEFRSRADPNSRTSEPVWTAQDKRYRLTRTQLVLGLRWPTLAVEQRPLDKALSTNMWKWRSLGQELERIDGTYHGPERNKREWTYSSNKQPASLNTH